MPIFWIMAVWLIPRQAFCADSLALWHEGRTKQAILDFVRRTTTPGGREFVPPEARIAVFDFDGTLTVEQPVYGQVAFCADELKPGQENGRRFAADPLVQKIQALSLAQLNDLSYDEMGKLWALGMAGASADAVRHKVRLWFDTAEHPRLKKPRSLLLYEPMLEVLRLLKARGFRVFVVTGSLSDYLRAVSEDYLGLPAENVIGSQLRRRWSGQPPFEVERAPEFGELVDGANKVLEIDRRIGRRPLMAFGNSDGDVAMLTYATSGPGPRLGALVHHDDAAREFAYDRDSPVGALSKGLDLAGQKGWFLISMKEDWKAIWAGAGRAAAAVPAP